MSDRPRREYDPSGSMAMFIASALQHPNPPCNGRGRRVSTIFVSQHKNKFDATVVYCTLAETNAVSEAWAESGHDGDPSDEFVGKCMLDDAQLYRSAYRKMMFLAPQYKQMLFPRCDYGYLIADDVAAAYAYIDERVAEAQAPGAHENHQKYVDRLLHDWRVPTVDAWKEKIAKVYKYDW